MIILQSLNEDTEQMIKSLEVPYDKSTIQYFYIESKKRYCYTDEYNVIQTKGLIYKDEMKNKLLQNIIIESRRNDKLEELGI